MNKIECAEYVARFAENGMQLLEEHIRDFNGDILLHVFVPEIVYSPLVESIRQNDTEKIKAYCSCIEHLWRVGDKDVLNVIEVSLLECLTDYSEIWQCFGRYISDDFKRYINAEYIPYNRYWLNIEPLKYK